MRVFGEYGVDAERAHVAGLIGSDGKRLAKEVAERTGTRIEDERAEEIDKRSGAIYDELNSDPRPITGARSLLTALRDSRLRWAIATSSRKEQVSASVASLRLPSGPRIVDGSHVEHAKPAPDLLLLAARQLETPPARCWYVGDSTWDMKSAVSAGMIAVGVPYGAVPGSELAAAGATVVTTLDELLGDLRRRGLIASR